MATRGISQSKRLSGVRAPVASYQKSVSVASPSTTRDESSSDQTTSRSFGRCCISGAIRSAAAGVPTAKSRSAALAMSRTGRCVKNQSKTLVNFCQDARCLVTFGARNVFTGLSYSGTFFPAFWVVVHAVWRQSLVGLRAAFKQECIPDL
jgi:hypothetical protein